MVLALNGALTADQLPPLSFACTVKVWLLCGASRAATTEGDAFCALSTLPSMTSTKFRVGSSSCTAQASDRCVGPASASEITGVVGGVVSRGSVDVTVLLAFDQLLEGSTAWTKNV